MFIARNDRQIRSFTGKLPGKLIRDMLARYRAMAQDERRGDDLGFFAVFDTVAELEDDAYGLYDDRGNLPPFDAVETSELPTPYLIARRRTRCGLPLLCYVPANIAPLQLADRVRQHDMREAC